MRKIKNVICIILASTILISCNNYSEFETEEIMSTSNSEVSHETNLSPDGKLSTENDTDATESKSNKNEAVGTDTVSIDSDKFIYKIWEIKVEEGSDPSLYLSPTFCITSIMDNKIKGKIATGGGPIYCNNSLYEQYSNTADLIGVIVNDKAECEFDYGNGGDKGKIELTFLNDTEIRGDIYYEIQNAYDTQKFFPNGTYIFRPRNIEDLYDNGRAKIINMKQLPVNLSLWGDVNITIGYLKQKSIDSATHSHAIAYVTDYEGNILYEFMGLVNGIEISAVTTEDLNNDGMPDVQISFDIHEPEMLVYTYFQMENGLFCLE